MKVSTPISRYKLNISRKAHVLEVGGGHDPHPRSNVVVDKYLDSNYHRSGDIKVLRHQKFLQADGSALPFKDNEFDYVICNHVLEHVDEPTIFLDEQSRVAGKGYLETPSLIGEMLAPKESHRWVLLEIDNKIVMMEKSKIGFKAHPDFGELFLSFLPKTSIGFKITQRTAGNIMTVRHEWSEKVDLLVNPEETYYTDFFTKPWTNDMCEEIFKTKSYGKEMLITLYAMMDILKSVFKSKIIS